MTENIKPIQILKSSEFKKLLTFFSYWIFFIVLTFSAKFYKMYINEEHTLFGDLKIIMYCGGFSFQDMNGMNCSLFIYGSALLEGMYALKALHPYGQEVAHLIVIVCLASLAWLMMYAKDLKSRVLTIALILSPPIVLLIQRANLDFLIFSLTIVAIEMARKSRLVSAIVVMSLTTLMKMYSLPLVLLFCAMLIFKTKRLFFRVLIFAYAVTITIWAIYDTSQIPWLPSDGRNSFGLPIFGEYANYLIKGPGTQSPRWMANLIGLMILTLLLLCIRQLSFSSLLHTVKLNNLSSFAWTLQFLAIFLAGISIDYRLIFIVPILVALVQTPSRMNTLVLLLTLPTFFLSYPFEKAQVMGDVTSFVLVALIIYLLLLSTPFTQVKIFGIEQVKKWRKKFTLRLGAQ